MKPAMMNEECTSKCAINPWIHDQTLDGTIYPSATNISPVYIQVNEMYEECVLTLKLRILVFECRKAFLDA